jgi:fatty-acyl-CoA synthase
MKNAGIGSWPARRARTVPDRPAVVFEGDVLTGRELEGRVTQLAHALEDVGVRAGDRVAYLGPNHPSAIETIFACGLLGAIYLPLNVRLTAREHDYVLSDADPVVLVHAAGTRDTVASLVPRSSMRHVCVGEAADDELSYEELLAAGRRDPLDREVGLDDLCMIQYTSGTSGTPKGVMLTHGNVTWNSVNMLIDIDLRTDDVNLVVAPLFHTAGMNNSFLTPFLKGATSVLMPAWDPDRAFDLIEQHRVTCFVGVPTIYQTLVQSPRWASADLSSLRTLPCGGSPVPAALIEAFHARGLLFQQGYGLTETSPNVTFLRPDRSTEKVGSAGTPCFFADLRISTPDGQPAQPGEKGEVLTAGPNVSPGYWNLPAATASAFDEDGWLRTGDVAVQDDDGFVYVVDRLKDLIISGGENIYPAEVEDAMYHHPAVREVAVVGVPDERWGEVGLAIVALKDDACADAEGLREFLAARLAAYKVPKRFVFVDALPRNASGKVRKQLLRSDFGRPASDA